ncbi:MAG: hypothetical protein LBK08_00185 [Treponema sp.]|jgi:hypothetical protein|nr:hypothetical protein [Treponema sp.]
MKKLIVLIGALLVFGLASCTTDFWEGFSDGYNAATGNSYEGELPPGYQPYAYRHRLIPN